MIQKSPRYRTCFLISAALLAAACAGPEGTATGPEGTVSDKDDLLLRAGFVPKKANSAARMASLKALPPHQFVMRTSNTGTRYLYADPTICACIYVGDQNAYDRYRQQMAAQQTARDEQIRAILSSAPLPGEEGL